MSITQQEADGLELEFMQWSLSKRRVCHPAHGTVISRLIQVSSFSLHSHSDTN